MINIERYRTNIPKENINYISYKDTKRVWDFNSIDELLKVVEIPVEDTELYSNVYTEEILSKRENYSHTNVKKIKDKSFFYFDDFETSINALKYGWENGRSQLQSKVNELKLNTNKGKKLKYEYDVVGGNACVPRYLQGIPTNMIKSKMVSKETKIINVYKTLPYTASVSSDEILTDSANTVIIIEKLEQLGYKVNLYVTKINENFNNEIKFAVRAKVKDAKMKLNLKKVSYCMMNPDMQRRVFWRLIELDPDLKTPLTGYGRGIDNTIQAVLYPNNDDIKFSKKLKEKYSLFFKMNDNDIIIPPFLKDVDKFLEGIQK